MKKLILFISAVLLTACSNWHGTGTVVQKDYDAPWIQTSYTKVCVMYDSKSNCKSYMTQPNIQHWPAKWTLKVRDSQNKTHWVSVSEGEYDASSIGGSFSNGDG